MAKYTLRVTGMDALDAKLEKAGAAAGGIAKAALYVGAGTVADAMRASLESIQTEPFRWATEEDKRLPSPEEKAAILSAEFGVARFGGSGAEVETSVGIGGSGYKHVAGRRVPVAILLRAVQSGTSFMKPQPVVRKAINRAKGAASAQIIAEAEARLQKIFDD